MEWLLQNKDWLFSGIGVFLIGGLLVFFKNIRKLRRKNHLIQKQIKIRKLSVQLSDIAQLSLKTLALPWTDLQELLVKEFNSHPILTNIDYEMIPIPLRTGCFALISKLNRRVTIHNIGKTPNQPEVAESWYDLTNSYLKAYALPFRYDHTKLIHRQNVQFSQDVLVNLLNTLEIYTFRTRVLLDTERFRIFHRLKIEAQMHKEKGDQLYYNYINSDADVKSLGQVAIEYDLVISCVHKIIMENRLPG